MIRQPGCMLASIPSGSEYVYWLAIGRGIMTSTNFYENSFRHFLHEPRSGKKVAKNEDKFKEMKSRFFGLMFTDGNIVVRMLEMTSSPNSSAVERRPRYFIVYSFAVG